MHWHCVFGHLCSFPLNLHRVPGIFSDNWQFFNKVPFKQLRREKIIKWDGFNICQILWYNCRNDRSLVRFISHFHRSLCEIPQMCSNFRHHSHLSVLLGYYHYSVYAETICLSFYHTRSGLRKRIDALLLEGTDQSRNSFTPGEWDFHDPEAVNRSHRVYFPHLEHNLFGALHSGLALSLHPNPVLHQLRRIRPQPILQHDGLFHIYGNLLGLLFILLNGVCFVNRSRLLVLSGRKTYSLWV